MRLCSQPSRSAPNEHSMGALLSILVNPEACGPGLIPATGNYPVRKIGFCHSRQLEAPPSFLCVSFHAAAGFWILEGREQLQVAARRGLLPCRPQRTPERATDLTRASLGPLGQRHLATATAFYLQIGLDGIEPSPARYERAAPPLSYRPIFTSCTSGAPVSQRTHGGSH